MLQGSIWEGLGPIFSRFSHVLGHVVPRSSPSSDPSSDSSSNPCQWRPRVVKKGRENRPVPRRPKTPRTPRAKIASPEGPETKGGWAAVIPPGGLQCNPPPTVGGAKRARLQKARYAKFNKILALCSASKFRYLSTDLATPLFFSPQELGDHRNPAPEMRRLRVLGLLGAI